MDADLSHRPEDVPSLLAASQHSDVVLGSRYVAGGSTPDWSLSRRLISRGGCRYARIVLGLPVRDLTGGFKCWNRHALEAIELERPVGHGYVFQIEMTYRALRAGLQVTEVPIEFRERLQGKSKMCGAIVAEAVVRVPRLRRTVAQQAATAAYLGADLALVPAGTDG
jgi:dolichol-phosphate mannosyltransferase